MTWFDTHAHLQDEDFQEDLDQVLLRAEEAGVGRIMLAASNEEDAKKACQLSLSHPNLYASVGVHPHEAKDWDQGSCDRLKKLVEETNIEALARGRDRAVRAIGEIGLDFHYDFSPRPVQQQVFWDQLVLSKDLDLPVIIHMREATAPMLEVLEKAKKEGLLSQDQPPGVIHCYSGSRETLPALLDLGFMIGFDGPLTFKKAKKPLEALAGVPLDRLVLETDAPYLTPHPYRGKRNESAYLPYIGQKAAEVLGLPLEDLARQTTENALKLFRIG